MLLVLQAGTTLREAEHSHDVSLDWLRGVVGTGPDQPLRAKLIIAEPASDVSTEQAASVPATTSSLQTGNALLRHTMKDWAALRESAQAGVIHHDPDDAFHFREGIDVVELYNTPDNPNVSIAQTDVKPGVTTALHRLDVQEVQRILQGTGIVELDGEEQQVGPGDVIVIPRGTQQRITNTGDGILRMDCTCTPRFTDAVYHHIEDPIARRETLSPPESSHS